MYENRRASKTLLDYNVAGVFTSSLDCYLLGNESKRCGRLKKVYIRLSMKHTDLVAAVWRCNTEELHSGAFDVALPVPADVGHHPWRIAALIRYRA